MIDGSRSQGALRVKRLGWPRDSRRVAGALGAILLMALALRVVNLGSRTLWYDEAFAALFAEQSFDAMLQGTVAVEDGGAADVHPLLYYSLLNVWMRVAGDSVVSVRSLSVVFGVLTIVVTFGVARDWFDDATGLTAALITAVAPFHIQYSQEARMYGLLGLTLMLATWAYWRAWQFDRPAYWIVFGILAGLSMYVQQLAAFFLLALGLLPILARDWRRIMRTGLAAVLALIIYAPWLLYLPDQMAKLKRYWVEQPNALQLWLTLRSFVSVNLDFGAAWWLPTFLLAAIVTVLLLYRGYHALHRERRLPDYPVIAWALWLALAPMVLMWSFSQIARPVFLPRALLPSALVFYIAVAWLFTRAHVPRPIIAFVAVVWVAIAAFGLVTLYSWNTFPNAPFDRASAYLEAQSRGPDVIVHGNKISALPMIFYARDLPQRFVRDIPGTGSDTLGRATQATMALRASECIAEATGGAPRVWYVAFQRHEDEMTDLVANDPANERHDSLHWLREHYSQSGMQEFNDLKVYLFVGPDPATETTCDEVS